MPTYPYIYADDLIDVLKKKHASGTYKSLVKYLMLPFVYASINNIIISEIITFFFAFASVGILP